MDLFFKIKNGFTAASHMQILMSPNKLSRVFEGSADYASPLSKIRWTACAQSSVW